MSDHCYMPKILVAEDDDFLNKLCSAKLTKEGFTVLSAADGVEALAKIKAEKPDLILLDVIMPKKNGFDVLKEMKDDPVLQAIPVVMVSNLGQEGDKSKGMQLGAKDYFVKANLSINDIVDKIKSYL